MGGSRTIRVVEIGDTIEVGRVDWAAATFLDHVLHSLWLDPECVCIKFDLGAIAKRHAPFNEALVASWQAVAPGSDAAVIEFDFRASGGAKRKLLRRLNGHVIQRRGGFKLRSATSLKWLPDYAIAYEIAAHECGGVLIGWTWMRSPLSD